jgi:pimeloyl-ACP methyl ester carboxylesterase
VAQATEETIELDGQPVLLRRVGDDPVPILYLHGLPTSSFDWIGPLELGGGVAVDLPGFGRSGKRADLDYSLAGHVAFLDRLLDALDVDRVRLCLHDWGAAVGLTWAAAQPERVERLVVVNGVPLLGGFRWRGWARLVRAPIVGPVAVGSATEPVVRWLSRGASAGRGPMARPFVASVAADFDLGTERALLRLLRSASPELLAAAGAGLGAIGAPALVLWGALDPWIGARFGAGYAAALGDATLETVADAGHWPWLDRPEVGERIVRHLAGDPPP